MPMKKVVLLVVSLLLLSGIAVHAGKVDIKDARVAGKNFYYERINQYQDVPFNTIAISGELTESENGLPLYYIFNFNNDKGYILVSADDAAWPVIGYAFTGSFIPDNLPENLAFWMEHYKDQIRAISAESMPAEPETTSEWARLLVSSPSQLENLRATLDLEPLLGSNTWDQVFPWNAKCPERTEGPNAGGRAYVGCVATSMTQIMYYWRFPETGQGSHCIVPTPQCGPQCADFGATTYEWNGMDNAGKNNNSFKESDPLAILSWHGGISVDMDYYHPAGSAAFCDDVPGAMKNYFKYANSTQFIQRFSYNATTWKNAITASLDAKCPIQYSGSGSGGGHAWVCDGYQGSDYFHMNWGWGGSSNGYFLLTNLNPGGYLFNQNQGACINIEPTASLYPPNCSGQTIVDAYDFGSIEDGSGPKADYPNNASCSWLIAPDDSVETITLNFQRFAVAAGDAVTVYDGPTTSSTVLGTYSGTTIPPSITSTGPQMLVTLTSDGSGTANGFQADYETNLVDFCAGSTTLTAATADFDDGSGRFQYRNSGTCKWYIKPDNAATTTLTFSSFNTEEGKDQVSIYDLGGGILLATLSGNYTTPPGPFTSNSGQILMIFNANSTIRGEGWAASYTMTVATPDIQGVEAIKVYPNPTSGLLNVSFNVTETQSVQLDLVSMKGTTVYHENVGSFQGAFTKQLDLSGLAKGIYMLKMTGEKGVTMTKMVVQ
jgi:hypothetical protein